MSKGRNSIGRCSVNKSIVQLVNPGKDINFWIMLLRMIKKHMMTITGTLIYITPENLKWIKNDALEVWSLHQMPVVAFWYRDWNLQNPLTLIAPRSFWYISDRTPKPPILYENLKSSEVKSAGPIPAFQEVLISDQSESEACVILSCIVSFGIVFAPGIILTAEFDPGILKAELYIPI